MTGSTGIIDVWSLQKPHVETSDYGKNGKLPLHAVIDAKHHLLVLNLNCKLVGQLIVLKSISQFEHAQF